MCGHVAVVVSHAWHALRCRIAICTNAGQVRDPHSLRSAKPSKLGGVVRLGGRRWHHPLVRFHCSAGAERARLLSAGLRRRAR